jgi:hypothetical protein
MAKRLAIVVLLAGSILAATPALALNWEGHDDWLLESAMMQGFVEGVPPPLSASQPSCAERAVRARADPSEQIPLPGRNCRPDRLEDTPKK